MGAGFFCEANAEPQYGAYKIVFSIILCFRLGTVKEILHLSR